MERYRYVPDPLKARGLAFRRSFLIGLVYDNPNAQYIVNMMEGALDGLRDSDYELVVHPCDRHSSSFITGVRRFVERQKLRGVILLPPISENEELIAALKDTGCDYVRVSYALLDEPARMLISNDRQAVAEVASYLQSLGHQRIGYITGPRGFMSTRERREGFVEALERRGLTLPADLIVEGGYTYDPALAGADVLLSRSAPDGHLRQQRRDGGWRLPCRARPRPRDSARPVDRRLRRWPDRRAPGATAHNRATAMRDIGRLAAAKLIAPVATGAADDGPADLLVVPHLVGSRLLPATPHLTAARVDTTDCAPHTERRRYDTGYQNVPTVAIMVAGTHVPGIGAAARQAGVIRGWRSDCIAR